MSGKLIVNVPKILENVENIKKKVGESKICAVVKANAYGIGILLAKYIEKKCDYFAVANINEAISLSKFVYKPILILSPATFAEIEQETKEHPNFEFTVDDERVVRQLVKKKVKCKVQIAVNTGMNRYGCEFAQLKKMLKILFSNKYAKCTGVFSHFYSSDKNAQLLQYAKFEPCTLLAKKFDPTILCHISNSTGTDFALDMVRVGIGLYCDGNFDALELVSEIKTIRTLKIGENLGYNANFVAKRPTKIAVVPLGYADGIKRNLTSFHVLISGKSCQIVGDICMDCFFVDVTNIDAKINQKVTIFGFDGAEHISVCNLAKKCDTISHEILTGLGDRIERIYLCR